MFIKKKSLFDCLCWKSLELVEDLQDINQAYSIVCHGTMNVAIILGCFYLLDSEHI